MKNYYLFLLIFILVNTTGIAQDYTKVDEYAKTVKYIDNYTVGHLAHALTDKFNKEEDKVRAIFFWMTENIEYAVDYSGNRTNLETVIRKKGVCSDYADLFKELCDSSGINSWVLSGRIKRYPQDIGMPSFTNHAWNAVEINNKKFLLDVTWAAGAVGSGKFHKRRNEYYYLCPPEIFIYDHFPEDQKWQLLNPVVKEQTFIDYPLIENGFMRYNVTDLKPLKGIVIDTVIYISFKSDEVINSISLAKFNYETYGKYGAILNKIKFTKNNNIYSFKCKIKEKSAYALSFYINGSEFAGYKLIARNYRFKLPIKINLSNKESTIKYILAAFRYKNLAQLNRTVYSKKKYSSFYEIENAKEVIQILSKWNGEYSGNLLHLMGGSNYKSSDYFIYRIDTEYYLKLIEINGKYYFYSIEKDDYHEK